MKVVYVALVGFYASLFALYLWGKGHKLQFNYPSQALYPVKGLDLSHHQGDIDWSQIKSQGYQFVFLKATEGEGFRDKRYKFNYDGAKSIGLKVGAYHFWSFCKDPRKQIQNILETVPRLGGDLVPALDMETIKKCEYTSLEEEKRVILGHLKFALEELSFQFGKPPVIYTTTEFLNQHPIIKDQETQYWVRSLVGPPSLVGADWLLWQYHNAGRVDGISGPVDLNVIKEASGLELIAQP